LEQPDSLDQSEAQDLKVLMVCKERRVPLDLLERLASKDPLGIPDPQGSKVLLGPLVQLVPLAFLDHKDSKATQVHKEHLVTLVPRVSLASKVSKV